MKNTIGICIIMILSLIIFSCDRFVNYTLDEWNKLASQQATTNGGISAANLYAYYNFENNFNDSSGNSGRNLTMTGNITFNSSDKKGGTYSAYFSGTNNYLTNNGYPTTNDVFPLTVCAWIKMTAGGVIFQLKGTAAYNQYKLYITNVSNKSLVGTIGNNEISSSPNYLNTGEWIHVAAVWRLNESLQYEVAIYKNGVSVGTYSKATKPTSEGNMIIGEDIDYGDKEYNGLIDEFRVYKSALTAAEIQQVMTFTN